MTHQLVIRFYRKWSGSQYQRLLAAFRKLRKEGYRCKVELSRTNGIDQADKCVYYYRPRIAPWWNSSPLAFYYKGDIEEIAGWLSSEGIIIGAVSKDQSVFHIIADGRG